MLKEETNMTRRGKLQVIKAGLKGVAKTGNKTSFIHGAETSFPLYKKYFKLALENNLLIANGKKFRITEKGWRFINSVETAEKTIGAMK